MCFYEKKRIFVLNGFDHLMYGFCSVCDLLVIRFCLVFGLLVAYQ